MRLGEASNCSFPTKFPKRPSAYVHKNTQRNYDLIYQFLTSMKEKQANKRILYK
jgi:hypothetical protein